jgi:hypothetical protein
MIPANDVAKNRATAAFELSCGMIRVELGDLPWIGNPVFDFGITCSQKRPGMNGLNFSYQA